MTPRNRRVVVVGAGGNIGSHLVPHLARTPEIASLTLIDRDRYEARNVQHQAIAPWQVGMPKAEVQAAVARELAPALEVTPVVGDVEDLPLGVLRGHVLLTCVDSRRTRQYVNQAAFRLLVPWIDAGVYADGLLVRLDVRRPGADVPCLECGWSDPDYAALEQRYPCTGTVEVAPSGAPSALGALAAALQAVEARKQLVLEPPYGTTGSAEQVVIDAAHQRLLRTRHVKNPACRFCGGGAYLSWCVEPLTLSRGARTLGDLLDHLTWRLATSQVPPIRVAGRLFTSHRVCQRCRFEMRDLRLVAADGRGMSPCDRCAAPAMPAGAGAFELLDGTSLSQSARELPLDELGLRVHDVLHVPCGGDDLHFEYCGPTTPARRLGRTKRSTS